MPKTYYFCVALPAAGEELVLSLVDGPVSVPRVSDLQKIQLSQEISFLISVVLCLKREKRQKYTLSAVVGATCTFYDASTASVSFLLYSFHTSDMLCNLYNAHCYAACTVL
jgi:hypothetical protein